MQNLFLFTGENAFLLGEERRRWVDEFARKHGADNISTVNTATATLRAILDEVGVMPFLAERRLVIGDGIPRVSKEEIQMLAAQMHPQVVLLIVDASPDKRLGGVKELLKIAQVKEFAPLKVPQLRSWMQSYAAALGASFAPGAAEMLQDVLGGDQAHIAQEVRKLSLAAAGRAITQQDVDLHVIPTNEGVVWRITDQLAAGRNGDALTFAHTFIDRGANAYAMWGALLGVLKNLVNVRAAMDAGHRSPQDLAKEAGVHPFAVRSLKSHAQRLKPEKLAGFLSWTAAADRDLKTGAYRTTDGEEQELLALIDRFILTCP